MRIWKHKLGFGSHPEHVAFIAQHRDGKLYRHLNNGNVSLADDMTVESCRPHVESGAWIESAMKDTITAYVHADGWAKEDPSFVISHAVKHGEHLRFVSTDGRLDTDTICLPIGGVPELVRTGKWLEGRALCYAPYTMVRHPLPKGEGWKEWYGTDGGNPPVHGPVEILQRDGTKATEDADNLSWDHGGHYASYEITAYRLLLKEAAPPPAPDTDATAPDTMKAFGPSFDDPTPWATCLPSASTVCPVAFGTPIEFKLAGIDNTIFFSAVPEYLNWAKSDGSFREVAAFRKANNDYWPHVVFARSELKEGGRYYMEGLESSDPDDAFELIGAAQRIEPAAPPLEPEMIRWSGSNPDGGQWPKGVGMDDRVRVRLRSGAVNDARAKDVRWERRENGASVYDVIAYAVLPEEDKPRATAISCSEWKPHCGGHCPLLAGQPVEVQFRDGGTSANYAGLFMWHHLGVNADVISYRILSALPRKGTEAAPAYTAEEGWIALEPATRPKNPCADEPGGRPMGVNAGDIIEYVMRGNPGKGPLKCVNNSRAEYLRWNEEGGPADILSYRVVASAKPDVELEAAARACAGQQPAKKGPVIPEGFTRWDARDPIHWGFEQRPQDTNNNTMVEVILENGERVTSRAAAIVWFRNKFIFAVVAYRVVEDDAGWLSLVGPNPAPAPDREAVVEIELDNGHRDCGLAWLFNWHRDGDEHGRKSTIKRYRFVKAEADPGPCPGESEADTVERVKAQLCLFLTPDEAEIAERIHGIMPLARTFKGGDLMPEVKMLTGRLLCAIGDRIISEGAAGEVYQ